MRFLKPYLKGGRGTQNLLVDHGVLKPYLKGGRGTQNLLVDHGVLKDLP